MPWRLEFDFVWLKAWCMCNFRMCDVVVLLLLLQTLPGPVRGNLDRMPLSLQTPLLHKPHTKSRWDLNTDARATLSQTLQAAPQNHRQHVQAVRHAQRGGQGGFCCAERA